MEPGNFVPIANLKFIAGPAMRCESVVRIYVAGVNVF
jgi:hypothetical protein